MKGGAEIGKEIFALKDRKGRELGLRFDLTVPLARVLTPLEIMAEQKEEMDEAYSRWKITVGATR